MLGLRLGPGGRLCAGSGGLGAIHRVTVVATRRAGIVAGLEAAPAAVCSSSASGSVVAAAATTAIRGAAGRPAVGMRGVSGLAALVARHAGQVGGERPKTSVLPMKTVHGVLEVCLVGRFSLKGLGGS